MFKPMINVARGSDVSMQMTLPTTGGPFDLTGWTVAIFEPSESLGNHISVAVVDAVAGLVSVRIEWDNVYSAGVVHSFRLQATSGAENVAWGLFAVGYV